MWKPTWGICVLLFFLFLAAYAFQRKNTKLILPLDEVKYSLGGLRSLLKPDSRIDCSIANKMPEMPCWLQNALVPATLIPAEGKADSTLYVFDANVTDSIVNTAVGNRKSFWAQRSEHFYFVMTYKIH